jgi:hypothetical protein
VHGVAAEYDPERFFEKLKDQYFSVVKETEKIGMVTVRFAAAEGRGAPLAEGRGADYAITKTFEVRKLQEITSFLLRALIAT